MGLKGTKFFASFTNGKPASFIFWDEASKKHVRETVRHANKWRQGEHRMVELTVTAVYDVKEEKK